MRLKELSNINLKGKQVILRTAYDVPLAVQNGLSVVTDDSRLRATIPTLNYLLSQRCKIVILTWLGRPEGAVVSTLRLDPIAKSLSRLIKRPVTKLDYSSGAVVEKSVASMKEGDIVLLENIRFDPREGDRDVSLADDLAKFGEVVVFDAFAQSHRDYPSTTGLLSLLPSVAGINMVEEISALERLLNKPKRPFVVVLGGAKISDKLPVIQQCITLADVVLLGGAMAHNFLKASGIKLGNSLTERSAMCGPQHRGELLRVASELLHNSKQVPARSKTDLSTPILILPEDLIAAPSPQSHSLEAIHFSAGEHIPWNWQFLDIGPRTIVHYSKVITEAKTIFWNGPMGYYESPEFAKGTRAIAKAIAANRGFTVAGGGDTLAALSSMKLSKKFTFLSTGGGASLEFLGGTPLPVLPYLTKK